MGQSLRSPVPSVHVRESRAESLTIVTEGNLALLEAPSVHAVFVASGEPVRRFTDPTGGNHG